MKYIITICGTRETAGSNSVAVQKEHENGYEPLLFTLREAKLARDVLRAMGIPADVATENQLLTLKG